MCHRGRVQELRPAPDGSGGAWAAAHCGAHNDVCRTRYSLRHSCKTPGHNRLARSPQLQSVHTSVITRPNPRPDLLFDDDRRPGKAAQPQPSRVPAATRASAGRSFRASSGGTAAGVAPLFSSATRPAPLRRHRSGKTCCPVQTTSIHAAARRPCAAAGAGRRRAGFTPGARHQRRLPPRRRRAAGGGATARGRGRCCGGATADGGGRCGGGRSDG